MPRPKKSTVKLAEEQENLIPVASSDEKQTDKCDDVDLMASMKSLLVKLKHQRRRAWASALKTYENAWKKAERASKKAWRAEASQKELSFRIISAVTRRYGAKRPSLAYVKVSEQESKLLEAQVHAHRLQSHAFEVRVKFLECKVEHMRAHMPSRC